MDQKIYDRNGHCVRCGGTNICHNCHGTGIKVLEKRSAFPEGTEVPCPTCYGGGDCKFCHGKRRAVRIVVPTVPIAPTRG